MRFSSDLKIHPFLLEDGFDVLEDFGVWGRACCYRERLVGQGRGNRNCRNDQRAEQTGESVFHT
jgi:hypothetical protein